MQFAISCRHISIFASSALCCWAKMCSDQIAMRSKLQATVAVNLSKKLTKWRSYGDIKLTCELKIMPCRENLCLFNLDRLHQSLISVYVVKILPPTEHPFLSSYFVLIVGLGKVSFILDIYLSKYSKQKRDRPTSEKM